MYTYVCVHVGIMCTCVHIHSFSIITSTFFSNYYRHYARYASTAARRVKMLCALNLLCLFTSPQIFTMYHLQKESAEKSITLQGRRNRGGHRGQGPPCFTASKVDLQSVRRPVAPRSSRLCRSHGARRTRCHRHSYTV